MQLVMAAMTTAPWSSEKSPLSTLTATPAAGFAGSATPTAVAPSPPSASQRPRVLSAGRSPPAFAPAAVACFRIPSRAARKLGLTSERRTRSCGRRGPASEASTVPRSSSRVSVYSASGLSAVWKRPCSFM